MSRGECKKQLAVSRFTQKQSQNEPSNCPNLKSSGNKTFCERQSITSAASCFLSGTRRETKTGAVHSMLSRNVDDYRFELNDRFSARRSQTTKTRFDATINTAPAKTFSAEISAQIRYPNTNVQISPVCSMGANADAGAYLKHSYTRYCPTVAAALQHKQPALDIPKPRVSQ